MTARSGEWTRHTYTHRRVLPMDGSRWVRRVTNICTNPSQLAFILRLTQHLNNLQVHKSSCHMASLAKIIWLRGGILDKRVRNTINFWRWIICSVLTHSSWWWLFPQVSSEVCEFERHEVVKGGGVGNMAVSAVRMSNWAVIAAVGHMFGFFVMEPDLCRRFHLWQAKPVVCDGIATHVA